MDEINNITNVIRTKDRELQKIQDSRFSQLEKTIEERDQMLLESFRRFERLKNDFQYNLRLLEARDREISRMESILEKHGRDREEVDQQVRNLLSRIECMEKMDKERTEKFEQEKAFNKRILTETKTVVESMQRSAEEDVRMKNSDISNLKRDIQSLYRAKDEAVENQQRDLTIAFEQIMKQREEQIAQREAALVHQIALLDQRLERLSTENMALKAKHEQDIEEITRVEEANRQLHYQIGESSRTNEQMEDSLGRQVSNLQYEMSKLQDQRNREKQELESQVEKFKNEAQREIEFHSSIEKRLENLQANTTNEMMTLNEEILVQQRRIHSLEQELHCTNTEKEKTMTMLGNKRVESDTLITKNRLLAGELDGAVEKNRRLKQNYQALEATMLQLQKEFDHYKLLMDRELSISKDSTKDEITELKRFGADQIQRMRHIHEEQILKLRLFYEDKLLDKQKEVDEMRIINKERLLHENREKDAEITHLKIQSQVKEKALQGERMDSGALRLRLKALEAQLLSSTPQLLLLKSSNQNSPLSTTSSGFPSATYELGTIDLLLPEIPTTSPIISEDFNMLHFYNPESPQLHSKSTQMRDAASAKFIFSPYPTHKYALSPMPIPPSLLISNRRLDAATVENEILKKAAKEMRQDVEDLRTTQETISAITSQKVVPANIPAADNSGTLRDTVSSMKGASREKQEEIELLNKRKNLTDAGNELRPVIIKVQAKDLDDAQEIMENRRDEKLGTEYHLIHDGAHDHSSKSQSTIRSDFFNYYRYPNLNFESHFGRVGDKVSLLEETSYPDVRKKADAPDDKGINYNASESIASTDTSTTTIPHHGKVPNNDNAITARSAPRYGYYAATRHLSPDEEEFVVHKVPSDGYQVDSSVAVKQTK